MKLSEAIKGISLADEGEEGIWNIEELFPVYNLNSVEKSKISYRWLARWTCTDTEVGVRVYYLRNEVIAVSTQYGRKLPEEFAFIDNSAYNKTLQYVVSLNSENVDYLIPNLLEQEMGLGYTLQGVENFNSWYHKEAYYEGKLYSVRKVIEGKEIFGEDSSAILIEPLSGSEFSVLFDELIFPYLT